MSDPCNKTAADKDPQPYGGDPTAARPETTAAERLAERLKGRKPRNPDWHEDIGMPHLSEREPEYTREEMRKACRDNYNAGLERAAQKADEYMDPIPVAEIVAAIRALKEAE